MSLSSIGAASSQPLWPIDTSPLSQVQEAGGQLSAATTASTTPTDQLTSDLSALFQAVQNGDMTAAQNALSGVTTDQGASYSGAATSPNSSTTQTDFQALSAAVKSGDTTAAQAALAKLMADALQASGTGHHHHHHHGGGGEVAAAAEPAATSVTEPATDPTTDSATTDPFTPASPA